MSTANKLTERLWPEFLFRALNWLALLYYSLRLFESSSVDFSESMSGSDALYFWGVFAAVIPHMLALAYSYRPRMAGMKTTIVVIHVLILIMLAVGLVVLLDQFWAQFGVTIGELFVVGTLIFNPVYLTLRFRRV